MNPDSRKYRDFAERLIAVAASQSNSSASRTSAAFYLLETLRPSLSQVIGGLAFNAVLSRALALANADITWLRELHIKPGGSLEGIEEIEARVDPKAIVDGMVIVIAEFVGLLVKLIGERLVLQLLRQAVSEPSTNAIHFDAGSDHEEKSCKQPNF